MAVGDYGKILQILIPASIVLYIFFLFCTFGDCITQRFVDIGNEFYKLNWYNLPLGEQKNLPKMIALSQKCIYLRGFADTRCTHETFIKTMKTTFSYFMVLRRLEA